MWLKTMAAAAFLVIGSMASATVIDFESYADGTDITGVDLGGITLTRHGELVKVTSSVPGGGSTRAIWGDPFTGKSFRGDFTGTVTSFSVDMGDFGVSDPDDLFVMAYSATDVLLDSVFFAYPEAGNYLETLSVAAAGIAYVIFGSTGPDFTNSIFADNLTFEPAAIPLPAGGLLLISALLGLGVARRRRGA